VEDGNLAEFSYTDSEAMDIWTTDPRLRFHEQRVDERYSTWNPC